MASLTDRVAIVTGGGDGIGRATALLLAQEGAKVVVADIATDAARRVAEEITRQKRAAMALTTDVTKKASVDEMVEESLRQWGRIDILVNIVGGSFPTLVMEMEEMEWERVVNLNLKSVYLCCRGVCRRWPGGAMARSLIWRRPRPSPARKRGPIILPPSWAWSAFPNHWRSRSFAWASL